MGQQKEYNKKTGRRAMAVILGFTMLFSMFLFAQSKPKSALAEDEIYIAGLGKVQILHEGNDGYRIILDENKNLIIRGEYFHDSSATMSYHTSFLYFGKEHKNGNPTTGTYHSFNVINHDTRESESDSNLVYDTYKVSNADLQMMIRNFFGVEGVKASQTVYMSEGYYLKERPSASVPWNSSHIKTGKVYSSLEEIREAADWSETTRQNFANYYDIELSLNLSPDTYNITVNCDPEEGGYIRNYRESAAPGATVNLVAAAEEGWNFSYWTVDEGAVRLSDSKSASASFVMPQCDVELTAHFTKESKPPITGPGPTDTPVPTDTPTPEPTATPPIPEDTIIYERIRRYYTTDEGYNIQTIYDNKSLVFYDGDTLSVNGSSAANSVLAGTASYSVGTDTSGNTWYFIPSGNNATYVHPKVYNNYSVENSEIKNIKELVFPSKISVSGADYTVISIGGGLSKYNPVFADSTKGVVEGYFSHVYDSGSYSEKDENGNITYTSTWNDSKAYYYYYGCVGNGTITSNAGETRTFSNVGNGDGYQRSTTLEDYRHDHYVYNTTLESVTIPASVTRIEDYAFYQCQALKTINGAVGVTDIGAHSFEGARVLTTSRSYEVTENNQQRNEYYYYNESYSLGTATSVMNAWKTSVQLSERLTLPEFGALKTIGSYGFRYHKNLFDVSLVSGVTTIGGGAFEACELNTITVPGITTVINGGFTTLGTKGTPAETVIFTEPEANAMHYGLDNEDYYIVRAGYPVTYHNNFSPEETYTSKAMVQNVYVEIKKQVAVYYNKVTGYGPVNPDATFTLDTEGGIWPKTASLPQTKYKELHEVSYMSGSVSSSYQSYPNKTAGCIAIAENGTAYGYDPQNKVWVNLNVPEGSTGHTWSTYSTDRTNGTSSSYGTSSFVGPSDVEYLYYLDKDGNLYRKKIRTATETTNLGNGSYTGGSYSGSFTYTLSAEKLPLPSNIKFSSFHVGQPGGGTAIEGHAPNSEDDYSYTVRHSVVYAQDTTGIYWEGSCERDEYSNETYNGSGVTTDVSAGYAQSEFTAGAPAVSSYQWTQLGGYRQMFAGGEMVSGKYGYNNGYTSYYHNRNIIDANGDLLFASEGYILKPGGYIYETVKGGTVTVLAGKNFVRAEQITDEYYLLYDASGGVWAYYFAGKTEELSNTEAEEEYVEPILPVRLFDDTNVFEWWDVSKSIITPWSEGTEYQDYYDVVILDGRGRYRRISTIKSRTYHTEEATSYVKWENTSDVLLDSFEEAIYYKRIGYEYTECLYDCMFVRDGYEFIGWNSKKDGSGEHYLPGSKLTVTEPTDVYAQWSEAKTRIVYHPNGHGVEGNMEDDLYPLAVEQITLKKNAYTRKGYVFLGWNTRADGSGNEGIVYGDGTIVTVRPGTTILYAQWEEITYILKVADEPFGSESFTIVSSTELKLEDIVLIPEAKVDRISKVSYNLNKRNSVSTIPVWGIREPFPEEYTIAGAKFMGWELYAVTTEHVSGYEYRGFYESNEVTKNLAKKQGEVLILFPSWGGLKSHVLLPYAICPGYDFVGFTKSSVEAGTYFADKEIGNAIATGKLIPAGEGSGAQYRPAKETDKLYAYYNPKNYEVSLVADCDRAEPGDIIQIQTEVEMTFDREYPNITVPRSERFVFMGYYDILDEYGVPIEGKSVRFYDEAGMPVTDTQTGKTKTWTIHDGSVATLYAYFMSENEVFLDGRGATKQEQTTVRMTYETYGPDVIPPEKTGYTFRGYYTEIRGGGKKYYNAEGKCVASWEETNTDILYAYWIQKPIDLPEKDITDNPEIPEEERWEIEVVSDSNIIQIYADDKNPATGAESDIPPYNVADIVRGGMLERAGGIPSTEPVAIRAKTGNWMLSCILERKSGSEEVCVKVTVPYRTQYEDAETEALIVSELQYETVEIKVPKVWSYWAITEGGIYFPDRVIAENKALDGGGTEVSVCFDGEGATQRPDYRVKVYGGKEYHVDWDIYDEKGQPIADITLQNEAYIISEVPGELPDVREYLNIVCYNAAWKNTTQFTVKSDCVTIDGVTLLSDKENDWGAGEAPENKTLSELKNRIKETAYGQTYRDGVLLSETIENGRYETVAGIIYTASEVNVGKQKERYVPVSETNEINIHTPVICIPHIRAEHEDMFQCEAVPTGHTVLVLDEEGIHSDFVLEIDNYGYHSDKKGYGEKEYSKYLAETDGKERNEVCFPFSVWVDTGNDGKRNNDVLWEAGVWYTIGCETQRFYVPVDVREGSYTISVRSVAVNGTEKSEKAEWKRNSQPANYVAEDTIPVYLTGRLFDFTVYEIGGTGAWDDVAGEVRYTVGETVSGNRYEGTLPLRTGVHPLYDNVGGLPVGGFIKFHVTSIGVSFGKGTKVRLIPQLTIIDEAGYEEADVYYEDEEGQMFFLRKWEEEDFVILTENSEEVRNAVRQWYGAFRLPDTIYVAEKGTDVMEYQKYFGLSFTEDFWRKDVSLMLRFAVEISNSQGECLYYGMIPEKITNNIWKTEAGVDCREDIDGNRYEIQGGEVAVIYPGDSAEEEASIHGIY